MNNIIYFSIALEEQRVLPIEADLHALKYIRPKYYKWDLELFTVKWFDYRFMTPLQATVAYAKDYETVYRRVYAENVNYDVAERLKFSSIENISEKMAIPTLSERNGKITSTQIKQEKLRLKAREDFSAFWRGRQIADALGMPYNIYIDAVMTKRLRNWNNKFLPRPIHLYRDVEVEYAQEKWEEIQASRLFLAEHSAYRNENYQNLPTQNDYHEWLFKQAELRSSPARFLARFVSEGRLPEAKARQRITGNDFQMRNFESALREFQQ